jgi:hypothetical protein
MPRQSDVVRVLLDEHGRTFADQAGIRLSNRPGPLYQLLVLSTLLGARISSELAVAAAKELFRSGYKTSATMRRASWQDRVDALDRGHYRRYNDRTATQLGDGAELLRKRWRDNVGELRVDAGGDVSRLRTSLSEFPGIGPTSADIFVREVQGVWPEFEPFLDQKVRAGAARLKLPSSPEALAGMVVDADLPRLASALVRVGLKTPG